MFVDYKNFTYAYCHGCLGKFIYTNKREKIDNSFYKDESRYMKKIDELLYRQLSIYKIDFYCKYDVGDKYENNIFQASNITDNNVILWDSTNYIEDWKALERYLYYKTVKLDEIDSFYIVKEYYYVNGKKNMEINERYQEVSREEFIRLAQKYDYNNI